MPATTRLRAKCFAIAAEEPSQNGNDQPLGGCMIATRAAPGRSSAMLHAEVAAGIHRISESYTNFYLVEDGATRGLTVVDACVPRSWETLQGALAQLGRRLDDIRAVVLTHGHFDHVGFAERARATLGVAVHVHTDDVPLTQHPWRYDHERPRSLYFATRPRALPIVGSFMRHRAFWPPPIKKVVRYDDDSGVLPVPGDLRVLPTPGHTIGHCALHLPDRDAVICGDALVTLDPYTGRTGPRLVARAATVDSARNLQALEALARTGASTVLVGHGEPWTGGAEAAVAQARAAGAA
jgi:glyoxylase-like metal-dependent hydrolase (beta-lactamase superfamily II)